MFSYLCIEIWQYLLYTNERKYVNCFMTLMLKSWLEIMRNLGEMKNMKILQYLLQDKCHQLRLLWLELVIQLLYLYCYNRGFPLFGMTTNN